VLKHHLKKYSDIKYIPIVVFSSEAKFKTEVPTNVIYYHELVGMIKSYSIKNIEETELNEIFEILLHINEKYNHAKSNHVRNVKHTIKDKETSISSRVCPSCGGALVVRNGKYGKFYGCSNYPNCRFTNKL
jgi:predicted RNA-binding Zn-ribbon protein involved in translation (DUF1610 family)